MHFEKQKYPRHSNSYVQSQKQLMPQYDISLVLSKTLKLCTIFVTMTMHYPDLTPQLLENISMGPKVWAIIPKNIRELITIAAFKGHIRLIDLNSILRFQMCPLPLMQLKISHKVFSTFLVTFQKFLIRLVIKEHIAILIYNIVYKSSFISVLFLTIFKKDVNNIHQEYTQTV